MNKTLKNTFGLGLRPCHYSEILETRPELGWFEIISENYIGVGGYHRRMLEAIRADYPIAMHGVGLSIGGPDDLDEEYLAGVKRLSDEIEPLWISDHICWTGFRKKNTHDLLPIEYTRASLRHVADRVLRVQDFLKRPLVLENPSAYVEFAKNEMSESEFILELHRQTGFELLLDLNNLFVGQKNLAFSPSEYLQTIAPVPVRQIHLAGHTVLEKVRVDTHDHPVCDEVWELFAQYTKSHGAKPVMIEWDEKIPEFAVLLSELSKARRLVETREAWQKPLAATNHAEFVTCPKDQVIGQEFAQQDLFAENVFVDAILASDNIKESDAVMGLLKDSLPVAREDGINVYNNAYFFRVLGVFESGFAALSAQFSSEEFRQLVRDFLAKHTSQFVDIGRFRETFKNFILSLKFTDGLDGFYQELAELEWQKTRLEEQPGAFKAIDLKSIPLESLADVRLQKSSIALAIATSWNSVEFISSKPADLAPHRREGGALLVRTGNDVVEVEALNSELFLFLNNLLSEHSIGEAIEKVLLQYASADLSVCLAAIYRWAELGVWACVLRVEDMKESKFEEMHS